jgi:hypothetical protein
LAIGFGWWLLAWLWLGFGLALATVQLAVVWKLEMVAVSNFYEEGENSVDSVPRGKRVRKP